ncbi:MULTISPECIES: hypothetical protein [Methylosinus]|uniref:Acyl carrier protein n=1 Tax=Methylosinus trichosporium (strain ATCC 35070 / NCIMB 11131 / UNIQEM 75 / OB3b) TaxID=595536 RepID=A0A2D2D1F7_METT3|nr:MULTISPECIES: hypothetical protein [Methylosinus]ATQ68804.1 hypothetical protein CQW49_13625 [Methylosinus trichosporium OB3b]OBS51488.1 hypothetical protein A8B73_15990 [Methylosinus sp. 3S-1]
MKQNLEDEVFAVLRTLTPRGTTIERSHRILDDLKLLSDDATAMALDLERKLKVRVPSAEWATVVTVGDVVDLLQRHLRE